MTHHPAEKVQAADSTNPACEPSGAKARSEADLSNPSSNAVIESHKPRHADGAPKASIEADCINFGGSAETREIKGLIRHDKLGAAGHEEKEALNGKERSIHIAQGALHHEKKVLDYREEKIGDRIGDLKHDKGWLNKDIAKNEGQLDKWENREKGDQREVDQDKKVLGKLSKNFDATTASRDELEKEFQGGNTKVRHQLDDIDKKLRDLRGRIADGRGELKEDQGDVNKDHKREKHERGEIARESGQRDKIDDKLKDARQDLQDVRNRKEAVIDTSKALTKVENQYIKPAKRDLHESLEARDDRPNSPYTHDRLKDSETRVADLLAQLDRVIPTT